MSPPDDRPEITPSDDEAWLRELHENPAYLKIIDEIDLDDDRPGVPAEEVRRWVESRETAKGLPKPRTR